MKAVLKYPGAKNRLANWIVDHIPEHKVYCEPFFGSGAVFFNKKACYNEIVNDLDNDVYNFFKILRDNSEQLVNAIALTPYSRIEYMNCYTAKSHCDDIEKARMFAVKCWQGFGCGNKYKNGFRRGIGITSPNPAGAWGKLPETLVKAAERLKNVQIENKNAIELIKSLRGKETFIYIDPPYLQRTRKKYLYNFEMSDDEHIELLDVILKSDCKIMISGYENSLYDEKLKGWRKVTKNTTAECSVKRIEILWMNYENEITLLDKE